MDFLIIIARFAAITSIAMNFAAIIILAVPQNALKSITKDSPKGNEEEKINPELLSGF